MKRKAIGVWISLLISFWPLLFSGRADSQQRPFPKKPPFGNVERVRRAAPEDYAPPLLDKTDLTVSIKERRGSIFPLLGVNAGPVPSGEKGNADLSGQFRTTGIAAVRTHDFYGPFDLSRIYPDGNAPPSSPASFHFEESDKVFEAVARVNCSLYLRLGDSYNDVRLPRSPEERSRLVRAAEEVVRHFLLLSRERQAPPLLYVEIGNEPDLNHFWPAGLTDFEEFFVETFRALKRSFPELKIGGPGFAFLSYKVPEAGRKARRFLQDLAEKSVQPDFISLHIYSNHPAEYYDAVLSFRRMAAEAGLKTSEFHVTEWNTERRPADPALITGGKAASYATAFWIALQLAEVRQSFLYRANDTSPDFDLFYGIFYADGRPKPSAAAFRLWSRFCGFPLRLTLQTGDPVVDAPPDPSRKPSPLWLLGAEKPDGKKAILAANISRQEFRLTFGPELRFGKRKISEIRAGENEIREWVSEDPSLILSAGAVLLIEEADGHPQPR